MSVAPPPRVLSRFAFASVFATTLATGTGNLGLISVMPAAGRALAIAWKLPGEIVNAIAAHHEPDELACETGNLIHVSEALSHALDLGEQPNNRVPDISDLACAQLGLSWPRLEKHFAEIEARYDGIRIALGI